MKPVILLDLDGVILNSESIAQTLWKKLLPSYVSSQLWEECLGMNTHDELQMFQRTLGWTEEQYQKFQSTLSALMPPYPIPFQPGALQLLNWLQDNQFVSVVVSSSSMSNIKHKLNGRVLPVNAFVTGEQVTNGKPHPAIYQIACTQFKIDPKNCIAIEDSPNGVHSALAAGIGEVCMIEDTVSISTDLLDLGVHKLYKPLSTLIDRLQSYMKGVDLG